MGLSLAWELSQRGGAVTVVDAQRAGRGASWAGAGILPPTARRSAGDAYEQLRSLSHQLHPQWAARLRQITGIDNGFSRCGGVYLARTAGERATLMANESWWSEHDISYDRWNSRELAEREPALAHLVSSDSGEQPVAWNLPDECQIRNPRHLQALIAACKLGGVTITESAAVQRLVIEGDKVVGVATEAGTVAGGRVCICSGAWARQTLEQLGMPSGIMPVRGQMVLYACPRPPLSAIVNEGHRYLVCRDDGHVLAGSVEEEVGYVIETTDAAIAQIRQWAEQVLPLLKQCPVEKTWAGLRPGSFDGWPYLGRVPGFENLFLAAGHYRSGLHLSCATAVVMANHIQGLDNPIDLQPFRIARG